MQHKVFDSTTTKLNADPSELEKLEKLATIDSRSLYSITTVFPFDPFPSTLSLDREKIRVNHRYFIFSREIQALMIQDMLTIIVQEGVFFSTIQLVDSHFPQETIELQFFKKHEALKFRRIAEGLIVAQKEGIDLSQVDTGQLLANLEQIGTTQLHPRSLTV